MSQRTSALAPPTAPYRPAGDLVVMAHEPDVPDWVARACRRSGRQVRIEPAPGAAEDRLLTVAALAGRSVLVIGPDDGHRPPTGRVVAAIRDVPSDAAVLAEAAVAAAVLDADVVPVHAVPLSFGERSVGLTDALARGHEILDAAVEQLTAETPGLGVVPRLLRVHPHELVGEGLDADLLVLGGPRHRIPARVGLVGCSAVQHAPCPVLLAPRPA
ncbi:universal stress protein [Pseudonocardia adelaidensis]|uniref:UspA domain-containing protein n=1 Tax=Pseudonocardia adelaidensis TaxID=648754 RepID=A0ABP9P2N6_9PSEU